MVTESAKSSTMYGWIGGVVGAAVIGGLIGYQVASNAGEQRAAALETVHDQKVAALNGELQSVQGKLSGVEGELKTAAADLESLREKMKASTAEYESKLDSQSTEIGSLKKKNEDTQKTIDGLQANAKTLAASLAEKEQALLEQTGDLRRSVDSVKRLTQTADRMTLHRNMLAAGVAEQFRNGSDFTLEPGGDQSLVGDNIKVRLSYASGADELARVNLINRFAEDVAEGATREMRVNDEVAMPVADKACYLYLLQAEDTQATFKYYCK